MESIHQKNRDAGHQSHHQKAPVEQGGDYSGNQGAHPGNHTFGGIENSGHCHGRKHGIGYIGQKRFPERTLNFILQQNKGNGPKQIGHPSHYQQVLKIDLQTHLAPPSILASFTGKMKAQRAEAKTAQMIMANPTETPLRKGTNLKAKLIAMAMREAIRTGREAFI